MDAYKAVHFPVLTDHYAWREVWIKGAVEIHHDRPLEEHHGYAKISCHDITMEELEKARAERETE